jgi:CubicO group peptidase (beta-lactamase class C family)
MTIHQLLCHTSGLADFWNEKCKQRRSTLRTIQAYLNLIAKGERFGYGTQHIPYSQGTAVGHGGRAFGAAALLLFLPEAGYTICVLSNQDRPADKRAFERFEQWLASSNGRPPGAQSRDGAA